jgi:hypothetical protein
VWACLQHAFISKAVVTVLGRYDNVVKYRNVHNRSGLLYLLRHASVCVTGPQVAAGVVVAYYHARGKAFERFMEYQPHIYYGAGYAALAGFVPSNGVVGSVKKYDHEGLVHINTFPYSVEKIVDILRRPHLYFVNGGFFYFYF